MDTPAPLRWQAYEHEHFERGSDWFWALGISAVCLAVIAILFHNALFGLLIIVAAATMALHVREAPPLSLFEISERGVKVDDVLHHWDDIISFWVEEDNDAAPTLLIDTTKILSPNLIIPLADMEPAAVRAALIDHCPEVPMREPLAHKILETLGF
jgi:hypothetical protein